MDDDFNTGGAIGVLFDLLARDQRLYRPEKARRRRTPLDELGKGGCS